MGAKEMCSNVVQGANEDRLCFCSFCFCSMEPAVNLQYVEGVMKTGVFLFVTYLDAARSSAGFSC